MAADVDAARSYFAKNFRPDAPLAVSWFEFLLDKSLLETHLLKDNADPSATDLIIQFLANALSPKDREQTTFPPITILPLEKTETNEVIEGTELKESESENKKVIALKILALRVTAFLKWNLDIIQAKIPLPMQGVLFTEFVRTTLGGESVIDSKQHLELDLTAISDQALFALDLYHRWCVRTVMLESFPVKPPKLSSVQVPGQQDPRNLSNNMAESTMKSLQEQLQYSVEILQKILILDHDLVVPTINSFGVLTEELSEPNHEWNQGLLVMKEEILCQTSSDLGCYYFFRQQYRMAAEMVFKARELYAKIAVPKLCAIDISKLDGYCIACKNLLSQTSHQPSFMTPYISTNLSEKIQKALKYNLEDIIPLVLEDIMNQEVPLSYWGYLASTLLNKQTVTSEELELHFQIELCNVLRQFLECKVIASNFIETVIVSGEKSVKFIMYVINFIRSHKSFTNNNLMQLRKLVKYLYFNLEHKNQTNLTLNFMDERFLSPLFAEERFQLSKKEYLPLSSSASSVPVLGNIRRDPGTVAFQVGELEWELLVTFDPNKIQLLLQRLYGLGYRRVPWMLVRRWELPVPLHPLVLELPAGLLQDHVYIMLAKAREQKSLKRYNEAFCLLEAVEHQVRKDYIRFMRFLSWEMLICKIIQVQAQLPHLPDISDLISKVQSYLMSFIQDKDPIMIDAGEEYAIFLINVHEWEFLSRLELERNNRLQFSVVLARTSNEFCANRNTGIRRASKELWDLILPMFCAIQAQQKRSSSGSNILIQRDNPTAIMTRVSFNQYMDRIKDVVVISLVISCLSNLHNILKDDVNSSLFVEHSVWPSAVSNSSAYSLRSVQDSLVIVLDYALKLLPTHVPWQKTKADLCYVLGQHAQALGHYLEAAMVSSDYFSIPIPKTTLDDNAYRRMVRATAQLHCHTQAAILCQFISEVDYTVAFKALQEKTCQDSMDAYYDCIWDVAILEFLVYIHNKRGEINRKQQVLKSIGCLELNFNNHEEIQREASNVRKSRFLRSLVRQYL